MKYLKFSLIALIPFILWGCPDRDIPFDSTVIFINNSDKTLLDYCREKLRKECNLLEMSIG